VIATDIEVVKATFAAFAARDVEAVLALSAPDIEFAAVTGEQAGRTQPYRGHDGMREYFRDVERLWEELVLHTEDIRVIPGSVIVIGHITGRRRGLEVRRSAVWTWRVKDGRALSVKVADLGDLAHT
jgi:ketosteroid isomerase-like protein